MKCRRYNVTREGGPQRHFSWTGQGWEVLLDMHAHLTPALGLQETRQDIALLDFKLGV